MARLWAIDLGDRVLRFSDKMTGTIIEAWAAGGVALWDEPIPLPRGRLCYQSAVTAASVDVLPSAVRSRTGQRRGGDDAGQVLSWVTGLAGEMGDDGAWEDSDDPAWG